MENLAGDLLLGLKFILPVRKDPLVSEGAPYDDPSSCITVEVDSEKEGVTATLALLNSMASELDNALDL